MVASLPEALLGFALLFFLPGFVLAKALFPERRAKGPGGRLWLLELVTLSFILSIVLTELVGFLLLTGLPGGFSASWSNPTLELGLAGLTVAGAMVGFARGAYRAVPPPAPTLEEPPGDEGGWELLRRLDTLARDERRLRHALRRNEIRPAERARLETELASLQQQISRLQNDREAEYAG